MTQPDPRRRWLAIGAAAVSAIAIVIVIVATAGGGDDTTAGEALDVVASTAPIASTSAPGSSVPATTSSTPGAATATTAPTATPTTAAGEDTTQDDATADGADEPGDAPSAPTTAPSPGSLVTVPTGTVAIADPIPPDEVGDFGTGVTAEIVTIEAVEGVAQLPGEISGPALRVRVRLVNDSGDVVNLSRVLVDVTYGPDRTPGLALGEPGAEPFIGELADGRTVEGVYVFGVPAEAREQVQVYVSYDVDAPILVFEGPAPSA